MPIIGHGDIASVLPDRKDLLFFAAGVSNSGETRESEYEREMDLLLEQDSCNHLVYFSSLSIFHSKTRYTLHKLQMEDLVRGFFDQSTIIRVGNITWGTNPHTLINAIRNKITNRESVEIQDVYRYIVEKEEFLYWINLIPDFSCEMNIIGRRMKVKEVVKEYAYPWRFDGVTKRDNSKSELQICL